MDKHLFPVHSSHTLRVSFLISICPDLRSNTNLTSILGVVVTSAVQVIYGVTTWNPLQVCELWSSRAAQFFAAFCWSLAVVATNISAK